MPIPVQCACGRSGNVPDEFDGRKVRCKCGLAIVVSGSADEWYYFELGRRLGPIRFAQLVRLAQYGEIGPETSVQSGLADGSIPACQVPGLFSKPSETSAPAQERQADSEGLAAAILAASDSSEKRSNRRAVIIAGSVLAAILVALTFTFWPIRPSANRQASEQSRHDALVAEAERERLSQEVAEKRQKLEEQLRQEQEARGDAERREKQAQQRARDAEQAAKQQQDRLHREQEERDRRLEAERKKREREEANRILKVQVLGANAAGMGFTTILTDRNKQAFVDGMSKVLLNFKAVTTKDGQLVMAYDVDIEAFKKLATALVGSAWISFEFTLIDKNGQRLKRFGTKERFTSLISESGDKVMLEVSPRNGAILGRHTLPFIRLKDKENILAYGINVRDFQDAAGLKVGVRVHSQYDP